MARRSPATKAEIARALPVIEQLGPMAASKKLGIPYQTLGGWVKKAKLEGIKPEHAALEDDSRLEILALQDRIRDLEREIKTTQRDILTARAVRRNILGLSENEPDIPNWIISPGKLGDDAGVPVLKISDLHWGEVVDPAQVGGVNEYNIKTANQRLQRLVEKTVALCFNHMGASAYPGLVVNLEGDLISGDIHQELRETNEMPTMPTFLDLFGALIWALDTLAKHFGRLFVTCVPGNHSRLTTKPIYKGRNYSNWDWLMGCFLERHFQHNDGVKFLVPDSTDAIFSVAGHTIMSTHGDTLGAFGGNGIIGALGPITRGELKTRDAQDSINQPFDILSMGHWHQYIPLPFRCMVNGSLIGYNEYAKLQLRAPYQPPSQTLYFVHPDWGITAPWAVFVDDPKPKKKAEWVKWLDVA